MNTHSSRIPCLLAFLIVGWAVPPAANAQSQTETEVMETIHASNDYVNENLRDGNNYSTHGALEFWSSGGLLQEIPPSGRPDVYDAINIRAKHIRVIPLVEGEVAVAHFYLEGSLAPEGAASVGHYLARATQVFVKEDGAWKIRSSHWSPVTGGSGTSQTTLED